MSTFVEVFSVDKNCPVIINLDTIIEIAPLSAGGCQIYFPDSAAVGGRSSMKVRDSYAIFKQFALQTVSEDDIKRNIARFANIVPQEYPQTKLPPEAEKRGRGRPPKSMMTTTADLADPHVE